MYSYDWSVGARNGKQTHANEAAQIAPLVADFVFTRNVDIEQNNNLGNEKQTIFADWLRAWL